MDNKIWKDISCLEEGNSWNKLDSRKVVKEMFKLLTPRQRLICNLLAKGHKYIAIARILRIDKTTVRDHLEAIRGKARVAIRQSI